MDAKDIFYITASVAFVLVSIVAIAAIYLGIRLQRIVRSSFNRAAFMAEGFAKTWGKLTVTSMVLRTIRGLIRRR